MKPQHSPGPTPCGLLLPLVSAPSIQVLLYHVHAQLVTLEAPSLTPQLGCSLIQPGFLSTSHPHPPVPNHEAAISVRRRTLSSRGGDWHQTPARGPSTATSCQVTSSKYV